jgi:hypothetical protein
MNESLSALVAMQSEYTSLAQIKACAKIFSESHDNDYMVIVVFNDNTMLKIVDEGDGLQYDNDFDKGFVDFVVNVCAAYKGLDLCFEFDSLIELFDIVESFDSSKQTLFAVLLNNYSYSYDIESLVNYAENDACLFEGSISDYAYELINDCYDTKNMGTLSNYIDYDKFGNDLLLVGDIVELAYNCYWVNPNDIC